ncbi:hypothetical protein [Helicobacter felis]|uniref:hypothetical protein n=1 Tax=Helicobacter felis TaxID=214 RepID=UPI001F163152|nr:hypothetical protein [Helicobacter felis]
MSIVKTPHYFSHLKRRKLKCLFAHGFCKELLKLCWLLPRAENLATHQNARRMPPESNHHLNRQTITKSKDEAQMHQNAPKNRKRAQKKAKAR